jgi:hypothetical protein
LSILGDNQHQSAILIHPESFLSPTTIHRCDLAQSFDGSLIIFKRIQFEGIDPNALTTKKVFADLNELDPSNPVKLPIFLVH